MEIVGLYRSPRHVYFGHYGRPAGPDPMEQVERAELRAGRGVVGDRFYRESDGPGRAAPKGQISFFAEETWLRLRRELGVLGRGAWVFRRNVVVRGADLNALIGVRFTLQGVDFEGSEYCKPCFWMDEAFAPGTLAALNAWKAGGLRARILTDGILHAQTEAPARTG